MPNKDLRSFILEAGKAGEILEVKKPVSPRFGIPAVAAKLEEEHRYPALLFSNVEGSSIPVLCNVFASRKRLALALECEEGSLNSVYREREDKLTKPVIVADGPVQEVVIKGDEVNLYDLPIVTHNEKDAGPYITAGAMVVKDPETGIRNIGVYRHMVHERNKLGIHMAETSHVNYIFEKYVQRGKPMPVAITIGHHPAFYLGVLSFVPFGVDEYEVVGGLLGQPLELVKCKTVDLEVPADAEIVLEGYIAPGEERLEGPFGEYTTLYGAPHEYPVITVTAITHRKNPIYLDCVSGHLDHQLLGGTGRLSVIFKTVKMACPTVQDVFMPPSGCCRLTCYVSIKKRHEGEAKNVIAAVFASDPFIKYVVVVDEDVNIFDDSAVLRAIATRLNPVENAFVIRNAKGHPLDPTSSKGYVVTKVGIDATKPLAGYPEAVSVPGTDQVDLEEIFNYKG
ncbi:UbiD decarboxylyase family [Moorella glycerini]|uniref:3-octaprenyl-4-hydroxybenzoate carboxy-lyase n=1 Tax=Neomoorella stamsii TaxID=1266720 RepID=A0A9X7J5S6_9FIRM|nr:MULTISPECIES: UbiD family decarboxylase [Moorella]PRR77889.1 3-octaprenyl-4-hydroxybenzoate carboxy-lyase [Moorella stamsii]CEP66133.1 UbiD decarboxylyase family [Moorella glycerini]